MMTRILTVLLLSLMLTAVFGGVACGGAGAPADTAVFPTELIPMEGGSGDVPEREDPTATVSGPVPAGTKEAAVASASSTPVSTEEGPVAATVSPTPVSTEEGPVAATASPTPVSTEEGPVAATASPTPVSTVQPVAAGSSRSEGGDVAGSVDESMAWDDSDSRGTASGDSTGSLPVDAYGVEGRGGRGGCRGCPEPHGSIPEAGEIDDNRQWNEYLEYVHGYRGPEVHRTEVRERYRVTVTGEDGWPVPNARVSFSIGDREVQSSLTYANGMTLFHAGEEYGDGAELVVRAERDGNSASVSLERRRDGDDVALLIPGSFRPENRLMVDVLFLLDTTGSMSDEIDRIKATLTSIARRVSGLRSDPDLRMGMVVYRDRGDAYVTKVYDFDGDPARFSRTVREVRAAGGDDYPESLNEALHRAIREPQWREGAVRLVFLVADAPPHLDYAQDYDYAEEMGHARDLGMKIFAVASSGLDVQGEYIFRQLAQQTMGRFIFLLYESGPQGELGTPHDVGDDFTVEGLDRLIVRLITEELESMNLR